MKFPVFRSLHWIPSIFKSLSTRKKNQFVNSSIPQNPPPGVIIHTGEDRLCFSKLPPQTVALCLPWSWLYSPCNLPKKSSSRSSRQVFWEELDPESAGLLSFLLLYPFILWFPLLLRHFSTEVKSGLVSLLDTETQKNREKEVLEWAHEHTQAWFLLISLNFCEFVLCPSAQSSK